MINNGKGFQPKNGRILKVIRVGRISTINQDERSLDDQLAFLDKQVRELYGGEVEYTDIATQGSGEKLDREELGLLEELIESGEYDLVICEDLARICRRTRAVDICELCEDFETRLIAVNDHVDTWDEGWRDGAFISTWHHERSNRDTSNRIKRSIRNRFINRFILCDPGPFYVVPDGAKTVDDIQKASGATEIVEHGITMLENGDQYSDVADWLNSIGFPVGGKSKATQWECRLVKSRFLDPRLKGVEEWNNKISVRVNSSGCRKSKEAPEEVRLPRACPHMA